MSPDLADRLSLDYLVWHSYVDGRFCPLAEPVRLPRGELGALSSLSERFSALLDRTVARVLSDPALLDTYAFAPELRDLVAAAGRAEPVLFARYDAFRTPQGWQFCEFNADVPGGVHEAAAMNDLVLGDPSRFRVVDRLAETLGRERVNPVVAICYASGYGEDLEQCQYLRREWTRRGLPAILCSPENLVWDGRTLSAFGERIDAVYRFFPAEWIPHVANAGPLLDAARRGALPMINGFSCLIAQSKKTMALWHERPDLLDADERALVAAHVPRTESFRLERLETYRRERERWVVKRQFGRVGEEVLIGAACDDAEWADWLGWPASEPGQWIAQERFESLPVDTAEGPMHGCYGPYVVAGRCSGTYNRFSADGFITYDARIGAVGDA